MSTGAQSGKENDKNKANAPGNKNGASTKKFMGGNTNPHGKVFEINSKDAVHQLSETVKAIVDNLRQEYTYGGDVWFMIKNMQDYNFVRPVDPAANVSQYEVKSHKKQLDLFWKSRGIYMDNKMKLYSLNWGQSSKMTQSKLEINQKFNQCKAKNDSLVLLRSFMSLCSKAMIVNINIRRMIKQRGPIIHCDKF
jgi:hypothetical protein